MRCSATRLPPLRMLHALSALLDLSDFACCGLSRPVFCLFGLALCSLHRACGMIKAPRFTSCARLFSVVLFLRLRLVSADALITVRWPARYVHSVFMFFLRWLLAAVDLHLEQAGTVVVGNKL